LRELLNTGDSTPEVTRVLAGLWRISVPFPYGSLPSTQVYVLETSRGPVLIDTGCDDERAWHALTAGMQACGFDAADTCGVLITHGHSDHHGLSGRVREVSGAWIAMSRRERSFIDDLDYMSSGWAQHMLRTLILCGVPEPDRVTIAGFTGPGTRGRPVHRPRRLEGLGNRHARAHAGARLLCDQFHRRRLFRRSCPAVDDSPHRRRGIQRQR
jgi:glyoxylase-like metal-dependent hydrolase (beta-lactamase superfamily II)